MHPGPNRARKRGHPLMKRTVEQIDAWGLELEGRINAECAKLGLGAPVSDAEEIADRILDNAGGRWDYIVAAAIGQAPRIHLTTYRGQS